jgi:hypothetical protein
MSIDGLNKWFVHDELQIIYETSSKKDAEFPGGQVAVGTKFCTVTPNIGGFEVWKSPYVTVRASRSLRWLLDFWKICAPPL